MWIDEECRTILNIAGGIDVAANVVPANAQDPLALMVEISKEQIIDWDSENIVLNDTNRPNLQLLRVRD